MKLTFIFHQGKQRVKLNNPLNEEYADLGTYFSVSLETKWIHKTIAQITLFQNIYF